MNDLISRKAAIDAIEEYADRLQMVNWKENPNVPYKVHSLNWCINTIRDLPSAQPEQRWIPVTEPPEKKGYYLVYLDDGSVEVGLWAEHHYFGKFEWRVSNWKEVTHWRELPETPKEEP